MKSGFLPRNAVAIIGLAMSVFQLGTISLASMASEAWTSGQWTGNGVTYRQIEQGINRKLAQGVVLSDLTMEYQAQAQNSPSNPKAQFAWAYSAFRSSQATYAIVDYPVLVALVRDDPKNVYEYTRLRFIVTRMAEPNNDEHYLQNVGFRLLRHSPQDEVVHKNLVYALCSSQSSLPLALETAKKWVQQRSNDAGPHAVLAYVYETMFNYSRGNDRAKANAAASEYERQYSTGTAQ